MRAGGRRGGRGERALTERGREIAREKSGGRGEKVTAHRAETHWKDRDGETEREEIQRRDGGGRLLRSKRVLPNMRVTWVRFEMLKAEQAGWTVGEFTFSRLGIRGSLREESELWIFLESKPSLFEPRIYPCIIKRRRQQTKQTDPHHQGCSKKDSESLVVLEVAGFQKHLLMWWSALSTILVCFFALFGVLCVCVCVRARRVALS